MASEAHPLGAGLLFGLMVSLLTFSSAFAQFRESYVPERFVKGTRANLFTTWIGEERLDGLLVTVPTGWELADASFLRGAFVTLPGHVESFDEREFRVLLDDPVEGPVDVILAMDVGDSYLAERLEITPIVKSRARGSLTWSETVRAVDPSPSRQDQALSFSSDAAEPVVLRKDEVPEVHLQHPFTISFWMKSTGLGEVVLSTWDGDDGVAYPVEIIVDRTGRLRCFRGRPGEHLSLGSNRPVADGHWHEVRLRNDPDAGWMQLMIDGRTVDSLYAPIPPAIRNEHALVLGGRMEGRATYFDGLTRYSGFIDEVHFSSGRSSAEGEASRVPQSARDLLHLTFEERIPEDLLEEPVRGAEVVPSDRSTQRAIRDFQVERLEDGVALSWTAPDTRVREFVVERSVDGHSFEVIARKVPSPDGMYRIFDEEASGGVVFFRVRQIMEDGFEEVSGTLKVGIGEEQPSAAVILGNYPNPFNTRTTISYEILESSDIELAVWDLSGQPVQTLVDRKLDPGIYEIAFDAGQLPSGTYFVQLRTSSGVQSHKVILAK